MKKDIENSSISLDVEPLDIKKEISRYLSYWPLFVVMILVTLFIAFFYLRLSPKIYNSNAVIKMLDDSKGFNLPTDGFIINRSNINLENEISILTSYPILERVVKNLNLNVEFFQIGKLQTAQRHHLPFDFKLNSNKLSSTFSGTFKIKILKSYFEITNIESEKITKILNHNSLDITHDLPFELKLFEKSDLNKFVGKEFLVKYKNVSSAVLKLKRTISVANISKGSDLIGISLKGEDKQLSEEIINTLLIVFNQDGIDDRQLLSQRTMSFIDSRFVFLSKELDSIERSFQRFKEINEFSIIEANIENDLIQQSSINKELFEIENQIELIEVLLNSLSDSHNTELLPINIGIENTNINNLISDFNIAVLKRNKFVKTVGVSNPALKTLTNEIIDINNNINESLEYYLKQLKTSRKQIKNKSIEFKNELSGVPEKERLIKSILRQQKIKESLYLLLLQKREEAAINLAITEPSIKVVEYALTNTSPISPKTNLIYILAFISGLVIPYTLLYIFFLFDTKLHDREDFEKITNEIPILAEIPQIQKGGSLLFTNPNATSVLAESFRILSANVDFLIPKLSNNLGKIIYCTSTIKGEGKTFVSLNLSLALSSLNKKVLLIGADMRNPQIHTYFGTSKNQLGLSSYLNDALVNWKELLMSGFDEHPEHRTMLSGAIPPNPAHLLTNGRFEQLIAEVRAEFDYVIVDTAPTILVTDTLLISKFADITLFLTKANYTDKKLLKFSKDLSDSKKITNMAYVINSVGAGKSYGYGYGYNYGYSYGYHEEN